MLGSGSAINLSSHRICSLFPCPDADCSGKTVIVTGSNTRLGKEAVRHFVRLKAKKVIVAVLSIAKGEAAKAEIEADTKNPGVIEVWELDYSSYASKFEIFEDNESTINVNVVSTTLLVLLLLPILRSVAEKHHIVPVIAITCPGVHAYTKFPERNTPNSLATLNNEKTANMSDRYPVSKLLQLFAAREIAERTANTNPFVIVNTINPGLCYTDLARHAEGRTAVILKVGRALLAWTAEGSRTLVHATIAGPQSHGIYINGCDDIGPFVISPEGRKAQKKVWSELVEKLERIQPGVTAVL
ncbi:putative short-chain dehydrogenase [Thermoascus aurantiacus ATCC 26904]